MGYRTLTEFPEIARAYNAYGGNFDNQKNIRKDLMGNLEVKTHMLPIKLGHMTNAETARLQMNILDLYPPPVGDMGAKGVYKRLSETPGIDRMSRSNFGKVVNILLPRIGGAGGGTSPMKEDQSWGKKYLSKKYPQVADLMYPGLKRQMKLAAMHHREISPAFKARMGMGE